MSISPASLQNSKSGGSDLCLQVHGFFKKTRIKPKTSHLSNENFAFTNQFWLGNLSSGNFKIFMTKFSEASPPQGLSEARRGKRFFRDEKMAGSKPGSVSRDSTSNKYSEFSIKTPCPGATQQASRRPASAGGDLATRGRGGEAPNEYNANKFFHNRFRLCNLSFMNFKIFMTNGYRLVLSSTRALNALPGHHLN